MQSVSQSPQSRYQEREETYGRGGNTQEQQQDRQFFALVERELHNTVTDEERAYLCSSAETVTLWDKALGLLMLEAQNNLSLINQRMLEEKQFCLSQGDPGKAAWFQRKADLERKRGATSRFQGVVQRKRFSVKQLHAQFTKQEAPASKKIVVGESPEQQKINKRKQVCKGYRMALHDIADLVGKWELPFHLALEIATLYEMQHMQQTWAEDPLQPNDYHTSFESFAENILVQRGWTFQE